MSRPSLTPTEQELVNRVRKLSKSRAKLSDEDEKYLDDNFETARSLLETALRRAAESASETFWEWFERFNLDAGTTELANTKPTLTVVETPRDGTGQLIVIDGLDEVAFDLARNIEAVVTEITDNLRLWEAWWVEMSVESSDTKAKESFRAVFWDEYEALAALAGFMARYNFTQARITRATMRLQTFLNAERRDGGISAPTGYDTERRGAARRYPVGE